MFDLVGGFYSCIVFYVLVSLYGLILRAYCVGALYGCIVLAYCIRPQALATVVSCIIW